MIDKSDQILVTGGNGFLGKTLIQNLKQKGHKNVNTFGSAQFDIRDSLETQNLYRYFKPNVVIHLAAVVGGIGANQSNPAKYAHDNLAMGLNMIERGREHGIEKLVLAGTVCAYPQHTPVPFKEEDLWSGYPETTNAPYGLAKKMLLVLAQAYRKQYGCNYIFLLPVNLYGPNDNFDLETSHVIPAMIRKFHEAKLRDIDSVTLWGDGSASREFLHVDDCAEAFVNAMEKYDKEQPINLGSGREVKMMDLAYTIKAITGYAGKIVWDTSKPNGQLRRCLDTTKAKELFDWEARITLEDGLKQTYDWYAKTSPWLI